MSENKNENVSYFVLEGIMTQFSLIVRRLIVLCIAMLVSLVLIVAGFIWYISLPVEESESVEVENDTGNATYIGNDMMGDFNYGESKENNN